MLKIFAKKDTDEKVLALVSNEQLPEFMATLNRKFGGDWVYVDKIHGYEEILHFHDEDIYRGFDNRTDRYSKAIKTLNK